MILETFVKWLIPFLCGGALSAVIAYFTFFRAIRNGLQCLLRAEIIRSHEMYTNRRFCPIYARESLRREYKAYHALGGNDVATALYEKTLALPVDPPSEEDHE